MIGLPWYLLAAGIVFVIIGSLLACLPGSGRGKARPALDARMRDDEIVRQLKDAQRLPVSSLVILAGFAFILVSIIWRIARAFM